MSNENDLDSFELDFTEDPKDEIVVDPPEEVTDTLEPTITSDPTTEPTLDEDEESDLIKANYEFLLTNGALALPEDYEFKSTPKGLEKALADSTENLKGIVVEEMFSALPDQGKQLLQYYLNGGTDIEEFIKISSEPSAATLNLEEESDQEYAVKSYYKATTSFSDAKIQKHIDGLKANYSLKEEAEELSLELDELKNARKAQFVAQAAVEAEANKAAAAEAMRSFKETVTGFQEINGVPYSKEDANKVVEALYRPIKLKDGTVTTRFNYNLESALADPKKIALLNKILESDFKFDFLSRKKASEAAIQLHKKLKDTQNFRGNIRGAEPLVEFDYKSAKLDI